VKVVLEVLEEWRKRHPYSFSLWLGQLAVVLGLLIVHLVANPIDWAAIERPDIGSFLNMIEKGMRAMW